MQGPTATDLPSLLLAACVHFQIILLHSLGRNQKGDKYITLDIMWSYQSYNVHCMCLFLLTNMEEREDGATAKVLHQCILATSTTWRVRSDKLYVLTIEMVAEGWQGGASPA